ncbi:MAG: hypothetical protein AAFV27_04990 [Pseudomonadota bacterium]
MNSVLTLFLLLIISACVATTPTSSTPVAGAPTMIEAGRTHLTYDFKDPSSAVFRHERMYRLGNGDFAVCGQVNGKNSFGAYIGFQPYYVRMTSAGAGVTKRTEIMAAQGCKQLASGTINIASGPS